MSSTDARDLLDPPCLARTLKAAATQSAHQDTRATPSSSADIAAARAALEVCEKTAALLRAQLAKSQGEAEDPSSPPPPAKRRRRTFERGDDDVAAASSGTASTGSVSTVSTDGRDSTFSWTKKIHTQQADGSWSTAVVPCESRPALVDAASAVAESDVDILTRMQDARATAGGPRLLSDEGLEGPRTGPHCIQGRARGHDGVRPRFVISGPGALG